ncbi:MAG: InlB B-repeat-containing protein [Clostridiales bacterium]|nr:InlB B-repeat-containing protein [Clostridiales bacterium]
MKKILTILIAILAAASISLVAVGCGGGADSDDKTPEYTVTWYDESGVVLSAQKFKEGTIPSYTYNVQDTAEWDYTFEGWATTQGGAVLSVLPAVDGEASYYAIVSRVKQKYTVTFDSKGGSAVESKTVEYGDTVDKPADPTYDGKRFVGWCTDSACQHRAEFPITVTGPVTLYASWNDKVDLKAILATLMSGYKLDPYSYIPEAMLATYSANYVNANTVKKTEEDYASFVNKSSMPSNGFGEQWHMIADNLKQSQTFFNALTRVEAISAETVAAFNNYIDNNPSDTAHYAFKHGIYDVTIDCDGDYIYYVLDFTATFPVLGEQTAQIALSMDIDSGERDVRIQLGNPNALAYKIRENGYTFALRLLGVRRAMFDVSRDASGKVTGHINEFLTASGVTDAAIGSAADFYIDGNYVTAVGNKAGGMVGFKGYICELYNKNTGKLISYEVRESISALVYNTLWFDLADVSGITSIKYDGTNFFVNNLSDKWNSAKRGITGGLKAESRRFDIEFRTQYFYAEQDGEIVEVAVKVPMLFVQEEVYDTLTKDVKGANPNVTNLAIATSATAHLSKQQSDYATLVDEFINNKTEITMEYILEFIGEKKTFN